MLVEFHKRNRNSDWKDNQVDDNSQPNETSALTVDLMRCAVFFSIFICIEKFSNVYSKRIQGLMPISQPINK